MRDKTYSYSELMTLPTYGDRLAYLKEAAKYSTSPRFMSNTFYKSSIWKQVKKQIKERDLCQDLGINGLYIDDVICIHHINPVTEEDLLNFSPSLIDPENLISTSMGTTHNYIHYQEEVEFVERKKGDTNLWR